MTLDFQKDLVAARCGNWTVALRLTEDGGGYPIHPDAPWGAELIKIQTGGYDNGPYPPDNNKRIPLGHVKSVMDNEGLSFEAALKTQFRGVEAVLIGPEIFETLRGAAEGRLKKTRRRIEDRLRKDTELMLRVAKSLGVEGKC